MALDAIYINVETNDVLATSFSAMHVGEILGTAHTQYDRRGNVPNLNDPRPLPGSFELGGLAPENLRYAAATLQASAL